MLEFLGSFEVALLVSGGSKRRERVRDSPGIVMLLKDRQRFPPVIFGSLVLAQTEFRQTERVVQPGGF